MSDIIRRGRKAAHKIVRGVKQEDAIVALLGRVSGSPQFVVTGKADWLYVRIKLSNGASTTAIARNDAGVPHILNLKVLLEREDYLGGTFVYVITGISRRSDVAYSHPSSPSGIPPHKHDDRYFAETEHIAVSAGAADAGKPVKLGSDGKFDLSLYVSKLVSTALTWLANVTIASVATTGSALKVIRDLAAASTDAPVVDIVQDNTGDDQAALRVQQDGTGKIISVFDGATEVLTVNDGGNATFTGRLTKRQTGGSAGFIENVTDGQRATMLSISYRNSAAGSFYQMMSSRGTEAIPVISNNNDRIAEIIGYGYGGAQFDAAAAIQFLVDAAPGADDMPGRIALMTSPPGSDVPINRVTINSAGLVTMLYDATVTGKLGVGIAAALTQLHALLTDAGTNAIVNVFTIGHQSSGTPAAGFGAGLIAQLESSTTANQDAGRLTWEWDVATHASRASKGKLSAYLIGSEVICIIWNSAGLVQIPGTFNVVGAVDLDSTLNVDGAVNIEGATVIDDTLNVTGAVDLDSTLNVDGAATFNVAVTVKPGTAADTAKVGGNLATIYTAAGNVGTGEDDLVNLSILANTLSADGQSIRFEAFGTLANNANNKRVRVHFGDSGTTLILDTTALSTANARWTIEGRIIRTGAATQKGDTRITINEIGLLSSSGQIGISTTLNQTLSGDVPLRITGEAVANNDIVLEGFVAWWDGENA